MTLAVFALTGCSFFENQAPKKQAPRTQQKPVKSAIKGFIKELHYEDSKYCYTIIASDTKTPNCLVLIFAPPDITTTRAI